MNKDKICDFISFLIDKQNMPLRKLAKKMDISHVTLANIINAKHYPSVATIYKLSEYFKLPIIDFIRKGE